MRSVVVVVVVLSFDYFRGILAAGEPVHVEALVSEVAVEALDVGVLDGLAKANAVELRACTVGPGVHGLADELGTVVADDRVGLAAKRGQHVELASDAITAD